MAVTMFNRVFYSKLYVNFLTYNAQIRIWITKVILYCSKKYRRFQSTSPDFNEKQPKHQNRNFLKTFASICDEICILPSFNPILDIPIKKLSEMWLFRPKIGINKPKTHWNREVHSTTIICLLKVLLSSLPTYYTSHACIWVRRYEWNDSKEERFLLWTPKESSLCLNVLLWSNGQYMRRYYIIVGLYLGSRLILRPKQMHDLAITCGSRHPQ